MVKDEKFERGKKIAEKLHSLITTTQNYGTSIADDGDFFYFIQHSAPSKQREKVRRKRAGRRIFGDRRQDQ